MAGTIVAIAHKAGVSRGTVDRALNGRGRVDAAVAEKIWQIAREMGYVPKHRSSLPGKDIRIGVITALSKTAFISEINRGIADASARLAERGVTVIARALREQDEEEMLAAIEEMRYRRVSGLAIMPQGGDRTRNALNDIAGRDGFPVVMLNSELAGARKLCYVGMDNRQSGRVAAGLMAALTGEKGRVLIITGYFSNSVDNARIDGFVEETKKSFPHIEVTGVHCCFEETAEVEKIVASALTVSPPPDGIFIVSGGQAGIAAALEKLQLPRRPYVIAYDMTAENRQALQEKKMDFLIDQNAYDQGYRAMAILGDLLLRGEAPQTDRIFEEIRIKNRYNL